MEPFAGSRRSLHMRRSVAVIAALIVAQCLSTAGVAQGAAGEGIGSTGLVGRARVQAGTVTYMDPATMNFICQVGSTSQRYWVTRGTRFRSDRPNATFFDLAVGHAVEVTSHESSTHEIADIVRF